MSELSAIRSKLGVRSVQQGTIAVGTSSITATATITSVSTSRSFVVPGGYTMNSAAATLNSNYVSLELTNATTVTATRGSTGNSVSVDVRYAVVEMKG